MIFEPIIKDIIETIMTNMTTIIIIVSVFPFDQILETSSISLNEEEINVFKNFFSQYLNSNIFKFDLEYYKLKYEKTAGYYENLQEKFLASSEILNISKNCKDPYTMSRELRIQFIKYIKIQESKSITRFLVNLGNIVLPFVTVCTYMKCYIISGSLQDILINSKALYIISYHMQAAPIDFIGFTSQNFVQFCNTQIPHLIKNLGVVGILLYKIPVGGIIKNFAGQAVIAASS